MTIGLAKLPDRRPEKLSINLAPDLHATLLAYAAFYEHTYGEAEPLAELIPAMLARFLENDRGFARRVRKRRGAESEAP